MSRPKKLPLLKLSEFQPGQYGDCFALLAEKTRGSTRDGNPYYTCRFRDAHRVATVRLWVDNPLFTECQERWQPGCYYKIRGTFAEHDRYGPQLDIEQIRAVQERDSADGFNALDFVERTRFDPEQLFRDLDTLISAELHDVPLRELVQKLLRKHADALKILPASTRHAYPFAGGWLEHTLNVLRTCMLLTDYYSRQLASLQPPLNRNLIVAAAVLQEIGRIKAVETSLPGQPPRSSISGELLGHPFLSCELILPEAAGVPELDAEVLQLLLHTIASDPRQAESSTSRPPRIPEALILHYADDLDCMLEMYARCLTRDTSDGPFTERDAMLGRSLLKQRKV